MNRLLLRFTIYILIILNSMVCAQNPLRSQMKAGIESGPLKADFLGEGFILKAFLKYNAQKKFSSSILSFRARVSPEWYNLDNHISGLKLAADADYLFSLMSNPFLAGFSLKRNIYSLQNGSEQVYNEAQGVLRYSINFSSEKSLSFFNQLNYRTINAYQDNNLLQNLSEIFWEEKDGSWRWGIGGFYENLFFKIDTSAVITSVRNYRAGPQLLLDFQRFMIFNLVYKFGMFSGKYKRDHQLSLIAGKYLNKKLSLFLFVYYLFKNNSSGEVTSVFTRLSAVNSYSLKLGYDLSDKNHIYFKFLYEDQQIVQNNNLISTWQGVFGLQHSF